MANKASWVFSPDGYNNVNVVLDKNKLSVNGSKPVKISKLRKGKESNSAEAVYDVDLINGLIAQLCVKNGNPVLVYEGRDVNTGNVYEVSKAAKWSWVFYILYIVNFVVLIGGAIGGAISGGMIALTIGISANKKNSTITNIIISTVLYLVVTVIEVLLAFSIISLK